MKYQLNFLFTFIFLACSLLLFLHLELDKDNYLSLFEVSWIAIIVFLFLGLYNLLVLDFHPISLPQIYLFVSFCFTCGSLFVYAMGYENAFERFKWYDENYMILATKAIILSGLSFQVGICFAKLKNYPLGIDNIYTPNKPNHIYKCGLIIFFLCFLFICFSFKTVLLTLLYGYKEMHLTMKGGDYRYFTIIVNFFFPLSSAMLCADWTGKKQYLFAAAVALGVTFIFLMTGSRGHGFGFLISSLLCMKLKGVKYNYRKMIPIVLVILLLIPLIKEVRNNPDNFALAEHEIPYVLLAPQEMGGSIQTLMGTMMIIPDDEEYQYGKNYINALKRVVPNLGKKQEFSEEEANLPTWITSYMNSRAIGQTGGVGFLQISEFYSQFGVWGILLGYIFLGYLLTLWDIKCDQGIYDTRWIAMSSFSLFILTLWIRGDAFLVRYIIWAIPVIFGGPWAMALLIRDKNSI